MSEYEAFARRMEQEQAMREELEKRGTLDFLRQVLPAEEAEEVIKDILFVFDPAIIQQVAKNPENILANVKILQDAGVANISDVLSLDIVALTCASDLFLQKMAAYSAEELRQKLEEDPRNIELL